MRKYLPKVNSLLPYHTVAKPLEHLERVSVAQPGSQQLKIVRCEGFKIKYKKLQEKKIHT